MHCMIAERAHVLRRQIAHQLVVEEIFEVAHGVHPLHVVEALLGDTQLEPRGDACHAPHGERPLVACDA